MLGILAPGIEFFTLSDGIEDSEVGSGVRSATGGPLPALRVAGKIGVDQSLSLIHI